MMGSVTEESLHIVGIVVLLAIAMAGEFTALAVGGAEGWGIGIATYAILLAVVVGIAVWVHRHPLRHADPDSRIARFEHWVQEDSREPAPRYCARCGRRRMRVTPFDYTPPTAAEQEMFCTPLSCEWYDEPSRAEPPGGTERASDPRNYRSLLWRPDAE
jgi:hypothetical protein